MVTEMRCYFRVDYDETWLKGTVLSMHGGTVVALHSEQKTISLHSSQILFGSGYMNVTGYAREGQDNNFKLVSVDISSGWIKPKEEE
jgi:hypothetical protein